MNGLMTLAEGVVSPTLSDCGHHCRRDRGYHDRRSAGRQAVPSSRRLTLDSPTCV